MKTVSIIVSILLVGILVCFSAYQVYQIIKQIKINKEKGGKNE